MSKKNNRDEMALEAQRRRQLEGNTHFSNLGEPIQKLLLRVSQDVSKERIEKLSKISVRLLAQVFDMLSVEEDPDKILAWLDAELAKNDPEMQKKLKEKHRRNKVETGASGDPIGLFRDIEKKNLDMMDHFRKAAEERDAKRAGNIAESQKRRAEARERRKKEQEAAEAAGISVDSRDQMSKNDLRSVMGAFDRASKNSQVDNSDRQAESEWWKQDEYRRDFEKLGVKGEKWNRVVEGGAAAATDAECASRVAWYKQSAWWKADKYKREWQATKDSEWWKEECYIAEWQDKGDNGVMWTAIDELAGFNKKGDRRPAAKVELAQRVEWYKANGPKGVVRNWCALTEGTKDRCTLDEKREREVYYRSGDWWKSEQNKRALNEGKAASCEALKFAGAAGNDRDWWKDESFRKDFEGGGDLWKSANAKSAIMGNGDVKCTEAEMNKRKDWFSDGWWKGEQYMQDFQKNGEKGVLWRARTKGEATGAPGAKMCKDSEARDRSEWYKSAGDREWWKDEQFLRDFTENGEKGKKWKAAFKEAAVEGSDETAAAAELEKRKKWMEDNWWKADRFVKDFQTQGTKGSAWKVAKRNADADTDWWKQGDYMKKFAATKKFDATPFWQEPDVIADFNANGEKGKKWPAKHAAAASCERGQEEKANAEELEKRKKWLEENFWRAPDCVADFAANGTSGKKWNAKKKGSQDKADAADIKKRVEALNPKDAVPAAFDAMFEADATAKTAGEPASAEEIAKREEELRKNWWKSGAAKADWDANGEAGHVWKAVCPEAAALGISDDPKNQASADELADRKKWLAAGKPDEEFWKSEAARKEFASKNRESEFWKNPENIEEFQKGGKKWKAKDAVAAAAGRADAEPASADELAAREEWLKKNFWKSPKYQEDFLKNGEKGTLWTTTQPDGKGATATDEELKARAAHYKPNARWQLKDKPSEETVKSQQLAACSPQEAQDREEWMKKNWWKAPEVKDDFIKNGKKGKKFMAKTAEAAEMGLGGDEGYTASPEELAAREEYFEEIADEQDWWKDPNVIEDFLTHGKDGARWTARNGKDAAQNMGAEQPATSDELQDREKWFKKNFWKAPEAQKDFQTNGVGGKKWKRKGLDSPEDAACGSEEEIKRKKWHESHSPVGDAEVNKRKEWFERQLNDEEKIHRRKWIAKQNDDAKRIHVDELSDVLAQLNDGQEPTPEQLEAIAKYLKKKKDESGDGDAQTISQEEFVSAVADTNFYVGGDDERLRAEQEALEAMQMEEMSRQEEEAAFLALEAEDELKKAGQTYEDVQAANEAAAEEEAYLAQMEAEEAEAAVANEDDQEWDEEAWASYMAEQEAAEAAAAEEGEMTEEEAAALAAEEEERLAAETAAAEEAWAAEELGEEDGTGDAEATIDEAQKEELEAVIEEEPQEEDYEEEEVTEEQKEAAEIDEMSREEKGAPLQWKLPLPEVTNPQYLKSYFTVLKFTPNSGLLSGAQKRVWVVDHFTRTFYNLDNSGKIKKEHAANKLLQLERNIMDPTRVRLMFFDSSHSYELQFFSPIERERFFETAQAIRPSIRVYAPDLTNKDSEVEACTTTIDGVGANTVSVVAPNATGKPVKRELTGECKINASKLLTEPVSLWTGTFNLSGKPPPRNQAELATWIPKDKYDIYAVACQEASYRKEEGEWFEYVQRHLGRDYLSLASMNLWDSLLIVLAKKKHLLKITCVEGSTKATQHKSVVGTKGGIGISLRFLETSMCFVTGQMAARVERTQMRNTNVEEIIDGLQLGIHETDLCSQFNHVFFFGDFNYRMELDNKKAMEYIEKQDYATMLAHDQMTMQKQNEGMFAGFEEPPITFPPTYRMTPGAAGKYQIEKGNAPSYCDRVLTRSMSNTWIKCTGYNSSPKVASAEHQPVAATFITRCVRPTLSCFMKQQAPIPLFNFLEINVSGSPGPQIKKPKLMVLSPMTARTPNELDGKVGGTPNPQFDGRQALKLLSVTQCQEYLETCHFIFIIRDAVEKRADKAHRGSAVLPMFGKVLGMEGVQQDIDCDILCHGKACGKLSGKFVWTPGDPSMMQSPKK